MDGKKKSERYRERAAQLRAIAAKVPPDLDSKDRDFILQMAREYDVMADHAKGHLRRSCRPSESRVKGNVG